MFLWRSPEVIGFVLFLSKDNMCGVICECNSEKGHKIFLLFRNIFASNDGKYKKNCKMFSIFLNFALTTEFFLII